MTMPPQPGQWGPGNQPPVPPPGYYPPQGGWGGPPPPKPNNTIKWLLAGVGVLLVIAITVGVTVLVTRDGSSGDGPSTTSASGPPIASADDTGPVEIITLEPTCQAWMPVSSAMTQVQKNGWADREIAKPSTAWTSTERDQYEAVAKSLNETADQAVIFARQTPHRLMRELYGQFTHFARAYADRVPTYTEKDNYLAQANIAASYVIDAVCNSITYGSAAARSTTVQPVDMSGNPTSAQNVSDPAPVAPSSNAVCDELIALRENLGNDTSAWVNEDPNVPASQWSPDRTTLANETASVMNKFADNLEGVGERGGDPLFSDLSAFGAVYFRVYANSLPTYVVADNDLILAGSRTNNLLIAACQSASG